MASPFQPRHDPLRCMQNGGLTRGFCWQCDSKIGPDRCITGNTVQIGITVKRMADSEDEETPPERDVKVHLFLNDVPFSATCSTPT